MTVLKKQLKAIRKLAVSYHSQAPEHFGQVITEIDLKLKEIEEQELDEFLDTFEESENLTFIV